MGSNRIHRLIRLITLLQSGRVSSAKELAENLGISRRTLFRDLNMLELAGIPYYHDPEEGFRISRSFFLPPISLTVPETLGLMLLGKSASSQRHWPLLDAALEAVNKLIATVPEPIRTVCGDLMAQVTVDPGPQAVGHEDPGHYTLLQRCIDEGRVCRIAYKSPDEPEMIQCRLEPYALHFAYRAWYVLGRTDQHQEVRIFKLTRFQQLEALPVVFEKPVRFKVEEKLGRAWQLIPEGRVYRVMLEFTAKVAMNVSEVIWHPSQKHEMLENGACQMSFEVDGLSEIAWWLCGYANQVRVLQPTALRQRVQEMLRAALNQYENSP